MDILNGRFVKKEDCVSREIVGETIIVPVRSHAGGVNAIYTMNESATMIWNLIDGQTNVGQIAEALCKTYDVAPEKATEDITDFIHSLEMSDLIHPIDESGR